MPRPSEAEDRRLTFTPLVAAAFAELGYRGTTTAALAGRCGVRENVLYRTWPTKRAMFLAAVEHFYAATVAAWGRAAADPAAAGSGAARTVLDRQAADHGRLRLYRVMFAGLAEDDPEIRAALADVYRRLHAAILALVRRHRGAAADAAATPALPDDRDGWAAWALVGLGAVTDIQRELGLVPAAGRQRFMREVGGRILDSR